MKKIIISLSLLLISCVCLQAQDKFYTKTAQVLFKCTKSPLEKIEATNKNGTCVLDVKTGSLQFTILMKGFEFERALMQEHFNENYVESSKFPRSEFKGQIVNNSEIDYGRDGEYKCKAKGKLQIHGETKDVEASLAIIINQGKITAFTSFDVLLSDYNIRIPSVVSDKISNNVNISVNCTLEEFKR